MREIAHQRGADFAAALKRSGAETIDQFLRNRKDYAELGKLLITQILLRKELDAIAHLPNGWNWLGRLFQMSIATKPAFENPPFGIVTFNYDRIARFGLEMLVCENFRWEHERARQFVGRIPIHHVYGHFLTPEAPIGRPGDLAHFARASDAMVNEACHGIRVVNDERNDDPNAFLEIQSLIRSAETVAFLGFGFDRTNLARLGYLEGESDDKPRPARVLTTTVGMTRRQAERVTQLLDLPTRIEATDQRDCHRLIGEEFDESDF
ncbi:MAG: hypothetical protein AAFR76_14405 [Planctomycetota bacterium]